MYTVDHEANQPPPTSTTSNHADPIQPPLYDIQEGDIKPSNLSLTTCVNSVAFVVPRQEIDKIIGMDLSNLDQTFFLLRYFESYRYVIDQVQNLVPFNLQSEAYQKFQQTTSDFGTNNGFTRARCYMNGGYVEPSFRWKLWGNSKLYRSSLSDPVNVRRGRGGALHSVVSGTSSPPQIRASAEKNSNSINKSKKNLANANNMKHRSGGGGSDGGVNTPLVGGYQASETWSTTFQKSFLDQQTSSHHRGPSSTLNSQHQQQSSSFQQFSRVPSSLGGGGGKRRRESMSEVSAQSESASPVNDRFEGITSIQEILPPLASFICGADRKLRPLKERSKVFLEAIEKINLAQELYRSLVSAVRSVEKHKYDSEGLERLDEEVIESIRLRGFLQSEVGDAVFGGVDLSIVRSKEIRKVDYHTRKRSKF